MTDPEDQIKAMASPLRMEILRLLDRPDAHFSHQTSADPVTVGVCVAVLAEHFAVSQPTMSRHLDVLRRAGFLRMERRGKWTYCSRDEAALRGYVAWVTASLNVRDDEADASFDRAAPGRTPDCQT